MGENAEREDIGKSKREMREGKRRNKKKKEKERKE